jgi:hypothetical protein
MNAINLILGGPCSEHKTIDQFHSAGLAPRSTEHSRDHQ